MNKTVKRVLVVFICVLAALLLLAGGYVLYVALQYSRIEDNTPQAINNPQAAQVKAGQQYTAVTYNIGFGAYNHDFSFFMDSGHMADGTPVKGKNARAANAETVNANTLGAEVTARRLNPDFVLFQEVDVKSDRSYKINQSEYLQNAFDEFGATFASNFHSPYLAYPFHQPHGLVESGLLTLSKYNVSSAVRRSFPVDASFPTKLFDLDRCYSVLRLPAEGGGELVLINAHMSAYDKGGIIRAQQVEMLAAQLAEERAKGNWVVVGGDFNHALCNTVDAYPSQQQVPLWVSVFTDDDLPEGFSVVQAENIADVATCRSSDMPYEAGVNYTTVLDGFIVSDNVKAEAFNVDGGFVYSDHNPVQLTFVLK